MPSISGSVLAACLVLTAVGPITAQANVVCAAHNAPRRALHCAVLVAFDSSRDLVGVRLSGGHFGFYLLSRTGRPIEIKGRVVSARKGFIAVLTHRELRIQSPAGTRTAFVFRDRLPRANSSGKEGAINADGSRVAVFLRPPGSSNDADSDAVGLVDVRKRGLKVIFTTEWEQPDG